MIYNTKDWKITKTSSYEFKSEPPTEESVKMFKKIANELIEAEKNAKNKKEYLDNVINTLRGMKKEFTVMFLLMHSNGEMKSAEIINDIYGGLPEEIKDAITELHEILISHIGNLQYLFYGKVHDVKGVYIQNADFIHHLDEDDLNTIPAELFMFATLCICEDEESIKILNVVNKKYTDSLTYQARMNMTCLAC